MHLVQLVSPWYMSVHGSENPPLEEVSCEDTLQALVRVIHAWRALMNGCIGCFGAGDPPLEEDRSLALGLFGWWAFHRLGFGASCLLMIHERARVGEPTSG